MVAVSEFQKGKVAQLECELSSESQQTVWQKDHQEIEMGAKYQVVTDSKSQTSIVKDIQSTDQGVSVSISSGEVKTSISLDLKGITPCVHYQTLVCPWSMSYCF